MRRWETFVALGAVVCALFGATRLPWHATATICAIVLLAVVAGVRLMDALGRRNTR